MVKKTKSANFDKNLDANRMVSQILDNLSTVAQVARENSNKRAPFDSGKLRNSALIEFSKNKAVIEWKIPYGVVRYYKNSKNPQTTRWVEKDITFNAKNYVKFVKEGVIE